MKEISEIFQKNLDELKRIEKALHPLFDNFCQEGRLKVTKELSVVENNICEKEYTYIRNAFGIFSSFLEELGEIFPKIVNYLNYASNVETYIACRKEFEKHIEEKGDSNEKVTYH